MLKVKLSTSPHVRHPAVLQAGCRPSDNLMYGFAPVGLLALIAVVRQQLGFQPELFDLNRRINDGSVNLDAEFYSAMAELIAADDPDVVGFMTECDSYHHVLQICEALARRSDCRIVLGGPHATAVASETMAACPYIDSIVLGEGERSFVDLLRAYAAGAEGTIAGVVRRSPGGDPLHGPPASLVDDLDDLPAPAYELYSPDPGEEIFLEVGRGCPFQCAFCSTAPFWRRRHRVKSPARILSEIAQVLALYGPRRVHFTHDLFTTDRKWVRAVCQALVTAGAPVRWTCSARTDLVDEDLLTEMAAAGCDAIYFGIESGSRRVLSAIGKGIDAEQSFRALALCRSAGIKPNAGFILGFPQDDEESARDTFGAYTRALEQGCKPTHIFGYCPFSASEMFPALEELTFTGHFIDLPLGDDLDRSNRDRIAAEPALYASYGRPGGAGLWAVGRGSVEGVDEFSPLVEAATLPAVALAQALPDGMLQVYRSWLEWISEMNLHRDPRPWRRWYGAPADFCQFLADGLDRCEHALPGAADVARALEVGFGLSAEGRAPSSLSMATYRSPSPPPPLMPGLKQAFGLAGVITARLLAFDITRGLHWEAGTPLPAMEAKATCLVWRVDALGRIGLLAAPASLQGLFEDLADGPKNIAQLIARWSSDPARRHQANVDGVAAQIAAAAAAGLVVAQDV